MLKISQSRSTIRIILRSMDRIMEGTKKLLIILHDNPDPDALAAGIGLKTLCESRYGVCATIAHGGMINRAENKMMVSELSIPLSQLDETDINSYDRLAMVDTQPGRGNNALPLDTHCHIVLDHHASIDDSNSDLIIYNKNIGATATLIGELLLAADLEIKTHLATAIAYAIRTETLELQREASSRDIAMYLRVYPVSSLKKIGAISWPKLPNSYFSMLSIALENALIFRHLIFVPIGTVVMPEIVAEMADLFLRRERVTWVLAMGCYNSHYYFSLRTTHYKGQAFRMLQNILNDKTNAGGHDSFAGGRLERGDQDFSAFIAEISERYANVFGYNNAKWKPLLARENKGRNAHIELKK